MRSVYRDPDSEGINLRHWEEIAEVHLRSYDIEPLLAGGHGLDAIQVTEMGDVRGKTLLHLQCHIGTDTLSWARLGARVTGVDFSPASLRAAADLAARTGLPARFVESSLYDLPARLPETFDIVYTSTGVLCWLSDLDEWGRIIADHLKPGGVFYMLESHPFLNVFDDEADGLSVEASYFHSEEPRLWPGDHPDYADPGYLVKTGSAEWTWSMGDILNALLKAGLTLEFLHEYDAIPWKALPCMIPSDRAGFYRLPPGRDLLPLVFTLRARRPDTGRSSD